jgi:glycosyltransferase involved in cell wall biosynthesis
MRAESGQPSSVSSIRRPYLLVLFCVPFYADASGRLWIDPLWAKDLLEHTRYIEDLTVAAPVSRGRMPANAVALDSDGALRRIRCVELPAMDSHFSTLAHLPRTCRTLWRECRRATLIHSAVAGWPLPEAWVVAPMLKLRRRLHYINVESSFWRLTPGRSAPVMRRLRARLTERLNRVCVRSADISTFTQETYRDSLLGRSDPRGHVVEASWIDEGDILDDAALARAAQARRTAAGLRLLFAGRLTEDKGVRLLLEAVLPMVQAGRPIELTVLGDGPLRGECEAMLARAAVGRAVQLRGAVPYGEPLFALLRGAHLLVVPNLTDEQPRIVYDAYAQGLPVLGSRTSGLTQCIEPGRTGWLFERDDVQALRSAIEQAIAQPQRNLDMAQACIERARHLTHTEMHRTRCRLLVSAFPELAA